MRFVLLLMAILLIVTGCGKNTPVLRKLAPLPDGGDCRVGILPFINESEFPQGAQIMKKIFLSELAASDGVRVIREGEIEELYRQFLLFPNQQPTGRQMRMIGGRLNGDIFIGGTVQEMSENTSGRSTATELALILKVYNGKNGKLLWSTYHHRRGTDYQNVMHLGSLHTVAGLGIQMSEEILEEWFNQGMNTCAY